MSPPERSAPRPAPPASGCGVPRRRTARRILVDAPATPQPAPLFPFRPAVRERALRDARRERRRILAALAVALLAHGALAAVAALLWTPRALDPGRPGGAAGDGLIAIDRVVFGSSSGPSAEETAVAAGRAAPPPAAGPTPRVEPPRAAGIDPPPPDPTARPAAAESAPPPAPVASSPHPAPEPTPVAARRRAETRPAPHPVSAAADPDSAGGAVAPAAGGGEGPGEGSSGGSARDGRDAVDRVAVPIEPARPVYPRRERLLGREADVELTLEVDTSGRVREVEVTRSAGERFDRASVEAVRRIRFRPAVRDGRPVRSRVGYTVRYRLDG